MDGFLKLKENWIVICTVEEEDDSSLQVQGVFLEGEVKENRIESVHLNRWLREWNEYIPIVTVSNEEELEKKRICGIEVVRCEFNR
jgi:hypothetical protein